MSQSKKSLCLLPLIILMMLIVGHISAVTPDEILKNADEIRCPTESFFMKVRVASVGEKEDALFEVYTKGKEKTVIKTLAPARNVGRNLLMDNENMYVSIPSLNRSVAVSLSQKLTGQAANGDIGRMRLYGDYIPTMDVAINKEEKPEWTLKLKAQKKGLTYEEIELTVDKKTFRPVRASYIAGTGKILKTAEFKDYKLLAGKTRPSTVIIQSATNQNEKSTLTIEELVIKDSPEAMFDRTNLK